LLVFSIIATGAGAAWMTVNRDDGFRVTNESYFDLYRVGIGPSISSVQFEDEGNLVFRVQGDKGALTKLALELPYGAERSEIQDELISFEVMTMWGPELEDPLLGFSTLLLNRPRRFEISDFAAPASLADFKAKEVNAVKQSTAMNLSHSTLERSQKLAAYLHHSMYANRGSPLPFMRKLSGLEQYRAVVNAQSGADCATHSESFNFFANALGLPTRIVDAIGQWSGVSVGAHTFVETYIESLDRWIYLDLQIGIAGIKDFSGSYLNAADVLHRVASDSTAGLTVLVIEQGEVTEQPFSSVRDKIHLFLNPQVTLSYHLAAEERFSVYERLKRLLISPNPGYSLGNTQLVWLRILTTFLFGILVFVWMALGLIRLIKR